MPWLFSAFVNLPHLGLFHRGEKRWQDLMEPQKCRGNFPQADPPGHRKGKSSSKAPAPVHHREIWFSPLHVEERHFADFAHSFLSKGCYARTPCLDQLSWLDVEKRSRTSTDSTENAVQNHGKIHVFVAITWWWKFPHWFKKSETRYHAVS